MPVRAPVEAVPGPINTKNTNWHESHEREGTTEPLHSGMRLLVARRHGPDVPRPSTHGEAERGVRHTGRRKPGPRNGGRRVQWA